MNRLRQFATYVLIAALLAFGSAALALALESWFAIRSPSMTFLIGVILSAIWFGRAGALVSAVVSFLVYNFYLVEPRFSFDFVIAEELLTLIFYIAVAMVIGGLAGTLRDTRERERGRSLLFSRLFAASRTVSARSDESELADAVCTAVREIAGGDAVIARRDGDAVLLLGGPVREAAPKPSPEALAAATEIDGWRIHRLGEQEVGALLWRPPGGEPPGPEAETAVRLLAELAAATLERGRLTARRIELDSLSAADKLRTALMSSISHDFRTPLATILTSASALRRFGVQLADGDRADMLASIEEEAERLNRFIGNILDMTRLDASALRVRAGWVDPAEVLEAAVERIAPRAGQRALIRRIPAAAPAIYVDPLLLEQAIVNLLENALVHTPASAAIEIGGLGGPEDVRLWVEDGGQGVPPSELERIFDKFHTGDRRRADQSFGLGLSISKGFVEAMGGRIAAGPAARGGLRVEICFPLPPSGDRE